MSRADKLLARMRDNPANDWRMEELETLAARYGIVVRKSGGSHVVFEHPALAGGLCVPAARPIKPIYVRRFVDLVERVRKP